MAREVTWTESASEDLAESRATFRKIRNSTRPQSCVTWLRPPARSRFLANEAVWSQSIEISQFVSCWFETIDSCIRLATHSFTFCVSSTALGLFRVAIRIREIGAGGLTGEWSRRANNPAARGSFAGVDMAVTCQVSYTLRVLTIVSGLPSVCRSSFIDRSGGTMF